MARRPGKVGADASERRTRRAAWVDHGRQEKPPSEPIRARGVPQQAYAGGRGCAEGNRSVAPIGSAGPKRRHEKRERETASLYSTGATFCTWLLH